MKRTINRMGTLLLATAAAAALLPTAAVAQDYPSRAIKIIVPAPPGGSTDVMTRVLAKVMGEQNNVPVVVENRAGAAGSIGVQSVIAAPPDGYTLVMSAADATTIFPMMKKVPPYRVDQNLTALAQIAYTDFLFAVPANSPYTTLRDLLEASKTKKMAYSSNGHGSGNHLWMELFLAKTGYNKVLHVPYKGAAPAVQGLLAGETDLMITSPASGRAMFEAGRMKPLVTSSPTRLASYPNVPTFAQAGFPALVMGAWFGVFGPAGMSPALADKLHTMLVNATTSAEYQKQAGVFSFNTQPVSRAAFAKLVLDDAVLLKAAIDAAQIPLED